MPIIKVNALTKHYGPLQAVRGIRFEVVAGEVFGFLGPNGAGKSTTIKMLATLVAPTGGSATLNGFDVVAQANQVRRSIGMVFQDPSLDDRLTADQNLRFHAMLYGVPLDVARRRIDDLLDLVELGERRTAQVRTFSGGMKRRLEIARGLLHYPRVLFLDEPTLGLDPQTRRRIWEHIHELRSREGVTIFMTTHYMDEAENCDRIAVIDHGQIVALDSPAGLKRRVGGDVITIGSPDPDHLLTGVKERFRGSVRHGEAGEVIVEREGGAEFVPRLVAAFPELVRTISVRQPTLEDVFLKLTGRAIRDESGSKLDTMRMASRMWTGGRR